MTRPFLGFCIAAEAWRRSLADAGGMEVTGSDWKDIWYEMNVKPKDKKLEWSEVEAWSHGKENGKGRFKFTKEQFDYYDRVKKDGFLSSAEAVPFIRERHLYKKADFTGPDPPGHMQPLGSHMLPGDPLAEFKGPEEFPHPRDFWKDFIAPHKAAVFRKALGRASKLWQQDYIYQNFGWVDVKLEPKVENRGDVDAYKDIEGKKAKFKNHRGNLSRLLDDNGASNVYAVSILPQAMAWDIDIPVSFLCGSRTKVVADKKKKQIGPHPYPHPTGKNYMTNFLEANLWLARGFTQSQLHYDKENIFLCCVQCVKEFVLIDTRVHGDQVPWARGKRYNKKNDLENQSTDWVTLDPGKVDLRVFSFMRNMSWSYVKLEAGDCIFMPYSMMHQVTTHREEVKTEPNILQSGVSFMVDPTEVFDEEACQQYDKTEIKKNPVPFGAFDILWYYDGTGVIPQGYPLPHDTRNQLASFLKGKKKPLTDTTHNQAVKKLWPEADMLKNKTDMKRWLGVLNSFAKDKEKGITHQELQGWSPIPIETWLEYSARIDGGLPCDKGQWYSPRTPQIWTQMEEVLGRLEKGESAFKQEL